MRWRPRQIFHRIVLLMYNNDVIGEDTIVLWYNKLHSAKGKMLFLPQMRPMVEWLQAAEEASDGEEPSSGALASAAAAGADASTAATAAIS